ncbi:MAG: hypothetical protein PHU44_07200 [Syntrophales bacterium]|nr:hypothetical protein [Syntrophales bacterium]MDD5641315.1 hypothetical protein [Syntrophales bacterium]
MNVNLFKLALERLESSDWAHFERLCSAFLVPDFTSLRTMASPTGDGGRDSELFSPNGKAFVAAQYSVASDWKTKIRKTVKRLSEVFPDVRILIYMSNQQIGGQADELKNEMLEKGLSLDLRDRNWFLERASMDAMRENAAEELIDLIARPYLAGEQVINKPSSALTSGEARAALLYLGLQWQDDIAERGLTKLSFDALVRAALRHTHSENRLSRKQIHEAIHTALPSADREKVSAYVNSALTRLTKRYLRHWVKDDEFCLTHEEHMRISSRLAELEIQEADFYSEVRLHCNECLKDIKDVEEDDVQDLQQRIPRVLEKLFLRRGESFVSTVVSGTLHRMGVEGLVDIILEDIAIYPQKSKIVHHLPDVVKTVIVYILANPIDSTQKYLKRLSDSYTLFSFLKETPDVQSATKKLFSHGTVWLDTTILLPLFAEQLEEDISQRRLARVFKACHDAGIQLRVTTGVIQEINAHMNTAQACSQYVMGTWRGRIPYLYYQFLHTGRASGEFRRWLSLFRGGERPEEDLAQYLFEVFEIKKADLEDASLKVDQDLRWAAERLWSDAHVERRKHAQQIDEAITLQLIKHDVETYLGVISLRKEEQVSELGYRHWLLTLDRIAWEIRDRLRAEFPNRIPASPLLSLSFLINNLNFGPIRSQTKKTDHLSLPLFLDIELSESLPHDIMEIADRVRRENEGLPEYVIKRKVRDAIDQVRRKRGCCDYSSIFDSDMSEENN